VDPLSVGASPASNPGAGRGAKRRATAQPARAASVAARPAAKRGNDSGVQRRERSATPRREADTRERILQAGAELVGAKGFNGCGLSEILARAEVPKGSFYHYFASKEDFGVALIERARDEYLDSLREHLTDRRRSAVGRLRSIFEDTRNECARTGPTVECLIPKLALETATLSAPVHAAVKCSYEQWSAIIAQVIREGQAAGEIDLAHDPDRLARVLVMLWEGAAVRMQIDRSIQPLDDFLAFVFDTLLRPESRAESRAETRAENRTRSGG
jgi:TetR/AcrR family transcriptional repressor of nem operon